MNNISAIYKIQSKIKPERIYIGSAMNIQARWKMHLKLLKKNKHHSFKLQRHYNKYGEADLEFIILTECSINDLIKKEQYYIDLCNPYFNICPYAGSTTGRIPTEETRDKLRKIHKGRTHSKEWRINAGLPNRGRKLSLEQREFLRRINIGNKNALGSKASEEKRRKLSIARKKRIITDITRKKLSESLKGISRTEEWKRKIGESNRRTALLKKQKLNAA